MSLSCGNCSFADTPLLGTHCTRGGGSLPAFMAAVQTVLLARCDLSAPCQRTGRDSSGLASGEAFDFVVVGAGPAGSVAAARLSELSQMSVLLLEAGPEDPTIAQVPGFAVAPIGSPLDWNLTTVPQERACLAYGSVCRWPRGRMLGGTSSMNGMMYTRGHRAIYDQWAASGSPGWSYDDVLPYFKKSERNLNPEAVDEGYHGVDGPMTVQYFSYVPPLADSIIAAGEEMGYRRGDLNGRNMTGINVAQMMVNEGLRHEPACSFLRPAARDRPNLRVTINAQVTKVLVDPKNLTAYGVQFLDSHGELKTVYANREVILSGGAIGSPQLLLLSGIGPKRHLQEVGVDVVHDLPGVGENLHNQVSAAVSFLMNDTSTQQLTNDSIESYLQFRNGTLSSTGLTQVTGFFLSKYAKDGVPDLQVFFDGYNVRCSHSGSKQECESGKQGVDCGVRVIKARPTVLLPISKGYLRLNSSDPRDKPLLQPNYFKEERDMEVMLEGMRFVIAMGSTAALRARGFRLDERPSPGCEAHAFGSDAYWRCVVTHWTGPEHHQAGTCRMGPSAAAGDVVDARMRVHGVRHLRVADASVFPRVPNSNPTAAIIMLGERVADFVKQDNTL